MRQKLFEKEFIQAINHLKLNDTLGTGRTVLFEIFYSTLHFELITEHDKEYLHDLGNQLVSAKSNNDNENESNVRTRLNCTKILNEINPSENSYKYNALLDKKNYRVFQLDFPKKRNEKINKLNIKIYRFGQEVIPIEL
jgi:hypothetical protein